MSLCLIIGTWSELVTVARQLHLKGIEDGVYILQKLYHDHAFYFVALYHPPPIMFLGKHAGPNKSGLRRTTLSSSHESLFSLSDR